MCDWRFFRKRTEISEELIAQKIFSDEQLCGVLTAVARIFRMLSAEPTDETLRGAYPALFRALRMVDLADEVLRGA